MNHHPHQPFQISPQRPTSVLHNVVTTTLTIIGSICIAIILNLFVFQSYYVDGESMSPTLHTNNRLVVSKLERTLAQMNTNPYVPERGQIVVIDGKASPQTEGRASELIKRVIGIPGDTVKIDNGVVTITNATEGTFNIDQRLGLKLDPTYSPQILTVVVPDGKVFVLGDNRTQGGSLDSRTFGLVDTAFIDGRLWARIMPFNEGRVF